MNAASQSPWKLARTGSTLGIGLFAAGLLAGSVVPIARHFRAGVEGGLARDVEFFESVAGMLPTSDVVAAVGQPSFNRDVSKRKVTVMTVAEGEELKRRKEAALSTNSRDLVAVAKGMVFVANDIDVFTKEQVADYLLKKKAELRAEEQAAFFSAALALGGLLLSLLLAVRSPGLRRPEATGVVGTATVRVALGMALGFLALISCWWVPLLGRELVSGTRFQWAPPLPVLALMIAGAVALGGAAARVTMSRLMSKSEA